MRDEYPETEPAQFKQDKISEETAAKQLAAEKATQSPRAIKPYFGDHNERCGCRNAYSNDGETAYFDPSLCNYPTLKAEVERLRNHVHGDHLLLLAIRDALDESVKLQSHYAKLLNEYDGGKRMVFTSVDEWIERLKEVE